MRTSRSLAVVVWLAGLSAVMAAPAHPAPLPHMGPTPLLHVLFNGPPGMKIAFFKGAAPLREFNTPVTVGLRPGYIYRVRISGFRGRPGLTLFPTLEVRGTLRGPPELPPARYPATFRLSSRTPSTAGSRLAPATTTGSSPTRACPPST